MASSGIRTFAQFIRNFLIGQRDLYKAFGYLPDLAATDMLRKYRRQDITKRLIETPANAIWCRPPELPEGTDTAQIEVWRTLTGEMDLWEALFRADKLLGFYRYAILVIGFDDGQDLGTPIRENTSNSVIYFQPYSQQSADIISYETDTRDPRYGRPTRYRIKPPSQNADLGGTKKSILSIPKLPEFEVHHSRVIHICEGTLEDSIYGVPRMLHIFNLLDDLIKTVGGSAEQFWINGNRGMQVDVDKDMEFTQENAKALNEEFEKYFANQERIIRTKGVSVNPLGSDVTDPTGNFMVIVGLLSAATGIPQRIILGSEAGALASTQDRSNWAERVEERRCNFVEPRVLRPLTRALHAAGVITAPTVNWNWPSAFILAPLEQAQADAQVARSVINMQRSIDSRNPIINKQEARDLLSIPNQIPPEVDIPLAPHPDGSRIAKTEAETESIEIRNERDRLALQRARENPDGQEEEPDDGSSNPQS